MRSQQQSSRSASPWGIRQFVISLEIGFRNQPTIIRIVGIASDHVAFLGRTSIDVGSRDRYPLHDAVLVPLDGFDQTFLAVFHLMPSRVRISPMKSSVC